MEISRKNGPVHGLLTLTLRIKIWPWQIVLHRVKIYVKAASKDDSLSVKRDSN
jgi:hypothetical protein